jgi:hypothetical protein
MNSVETLTEKRADTYALEALALAFSHQAKSFSSLPSSPSAFVS